MAPPETDKLLSGRAITQAQARTCKLEMSKKNGPRQPVSGSKAQ